MADPACPACGSTALFGPSHVILPDGEDVPFYDCKRCHCLFAVKEAAPDD